MHLYEWGGALLMRRRWDTFDEMSLLLRHIFIHFLTHIVACCILLLLVALLSTQQYIRAELKWLLIILLCLRCRPSMKGIMKECTQLFQLSRFIFIYAAQIWRWLYCNIMFCCIDLTMICLCKYMTSVKHNGIRLHR